MNSTNEKPIALTSLPSQEGLPSQGGLGEAWRRFLVPVTPQKRALLEQRWEELPQAVRTDRQVVGRQLTHCGYTMGAAYCSFGCTHCYLPNNANQAPLPSLAEMKEQIDANYRLLGDGGALQITGGDVLDAYWKADRAWELIDIVRYATDVGLVPMLMTHGQVLLEDPDYFDGLVRDGGLRRVAIHIDMTQAGRPGYPRKEIRSEVDLHPLREQFVELIEGVEGRTGCSVSGALTVTVTGDNIQSVGEIVRWLCADVRRIRAFGMISFQSEADVGRTRFSEHPVTPETVWERFCSALSLNLARTTLQFGHPDCSSVGAVVVDGQGGPHLNVMPDTKESHDLLAEGLRVFGGMGSRGVSNLVANAQRLSLLLRRPAILWTAVKFGFSLRRSRSGVSLPQLVWNSLRGKTAILNVVMHNFMSTEETADPRTEVIEERLAACSFRGAVKKDGVWQAVPMCTMNAEEREGIYDGEIRAQAKEELVQLRRAS